MYCVCVHCVSCLFCLPYHCLIHSFSVLHSLFPLFSSVWLSCAIFFLFHSHLWFHYWFLPIFSTFVSKNYLLSPYYHSTSLSLSRISSPSSVSWIMVILDSLRQLLACPGWEVLGDQFALTKPVKVLAAEAVFSGFHHQTYTHHMIIIYHSDSGGHHTLTQTQCYLAWKWHG